MDNYKKFIDPSIKRKSEIIQDSLQFVKNTKIPLFSLVEISDSGTCNRSCSFCPRSNFSKDIYFYDYDSFENCLKKISERRLKNEKLHLFDKNCTRWINLLKLNEAKPRFDFENLKNIL